MIIINEVIIIQKILTRVMKGQVYTRFLLKLNLLSSLSLSKKEKKYC